MTDLFVSQDGADIRVCKRDEENLKQLREFLDGYGRPVGAPEPWRREIYGLWGDLSRAVRIAERQLAQAEKMKAALEGVLDHGIPHLLEHWREPDKPNGVSAWKEWEQSEKEARAALAKAYGEES